MFKIIALLFVCHFIADFLLQSSKMAVEKSQKLLVLFKHIGIHFLVFLSIMPVLSSMTFSMAFEFAFINSVLHGIVDWNVWRGYKYSIYKRHQEEIDASLHPFIRLEEIKAEWKFYNDHWFWKTIGLDQMLHALSILFAFNICCMTII